MIRYWNRLINMDDSRLCKKVFLWNYSICGDNWCAEIKDILSKIGMTRSFENKEVCILNNAMVKLFKLYAKEWPAKITNVRTYVKDLINATYKTSCM